MNADPIQIVISCFVVWLILTYVFGYIMTKIQNKIEGGIHRANNVAEHICIGIMWEILLFCIYWIGYFLLWCFTNVYCLIW